MDLFCTLLYYMYIAHFCAGCSSISVNVLLCTEGSHAVDSNKAAAGSFRSDLTSPHVFYLIQRRPKWQTLIHPSRPWARSPPIKSGFPNTATTNSPPPAASPPSQTAAPAPTNEPTPPPTAPTSMVWALYPGTIAGSATAGSAKSSGRTGSKSVG